MSSKKAATKVSELAIQHLRRDIFGHAPVLNMSSGFQILKKPYTGPYIARYYMENQNIDRVARKVVPGYTSDLQDRRATKLFNLRRRGKGPPKKGAGKRSKK